MSVSFLTKGLLFFWRSVVVGLRLSPAEGLCFRIVAAG